MTTTMTATFDGEWRSTAAAAELTAYECGGKLRPTRTEEW